MKILSVAEAAQVVKSGGIVAYPTNRPQVRSIAFRQDELVLVCSPDNPFSRYGSISLKKISGQPFVTFQREVPTRKAMDEILKQHAVSVITKAEFDNIELIKRAVEIGLGLSLLPSMTVKSEIEAGLLSALSLAEGPFMRPIGIVYRRGRSLPDAVKKFIAVLTSND